MAGLDFNRDIRDAYGQWMQAPPSPDGRPTWEFVGGPTPEDTFGNVGGQMGNEDLAAALYMLENAGGITSQYLPDYLPQPVANAVAYPADLGLSALMALYGGTQKAVGYGSELVGGDAASERRLARDVMAMVDTGVPEMAAFVPTLSAGYRAARSGVMNAAADLADPAVNAIRARRYLDPNLAYLTHEAQPYSAAGFMPDPTQAFVNPRWHLPTMAAADEAERAAFAAHPESTWVNPQTGGDILSEIVGARTLPTLEGVGMYDGPTGLESNPLFIGRSYATDPQLAATEAVRGYIDVQGATPWTRLRSGEDPAIFIPRSASQTASTEEMQRIAEIGSRFKLPDVMDIGDGYVVTNFDAPTAITREARKALEGFGGTPIATTRSGGYPSYEMFIDKDNNNMVTQGWEQGIRSATDRLRSNLEGADPAAISAIQSSPEVADIARQRMIRDNQVGGWSGVDTGIQNARRTIAGGGDWLDRLYAQADAYRTGDIRPMQGPMSEPVNTPAIHWSENLRDVIDPNQQFTNPNMRGTEKSLPYPYPAQSYFGTEGYVKEGNLGNALHGVDLPLSNYLDLEGPQAQNMRDIARENIQAYIDASGRPLNRYEIEDMVTSYMMQMARQSNYSGLINPSRNIATSFEPVTPIWSRLTGE